MTGVVADSHAIVWYLQGSDRLSAAAASALAEAEVGDGIVVSVATLIDLWYVTQTTEGVSSTDLSRLRAMLADSSSVDLHPIDVPIADAVTSISRAVLADPWDRFHRRNGHGARSSTGHTGRRDHEVRARRNCLVVRTSRGVSGVGRFGGRRGTSGHWSESRP